MRLHAGRRPPPPPRRSRPTAPACSGDDPADRPAARARSRAGRRATGARPRRRAGRAARSRTRARSARRGHDRRADRRGEVQRRGIVGDQHRGPLDQRRRGAERRAPPPRYGPDPGAAAHDPRRPAPRRRVRPRPRPARSSARGELGVAGPALGAPDRARRQRHEARRRRRAPRSQASAAARSSAVEVDPDRRGVPPARLPARASSRSTSWPSPAATRGWCRCAAAGLSAKPTRSPIAGEQRERGRAPRAVRQIGAERSRASGAAGPAATAPRRPPIRAPLVVADDGADGRMASRAARPPPASSPRPPARAPPRAPASSGVVSTTSPRNAVWMTSVGRACDRLTASLAHRPSVLIPPAAPPGTPPAGSPRRRSASCASSPPSASRGACASA